MNINYGIKIKELREQANITQQTLAEAIGIKRSSLKQFERQYDIIPIKRLNQIANFFDVSIDYILGLNSIKKYDNTKIEIDMNISSLRLKIFRKDNKLSQQKLADNLKISRSVIVYHENKRTVLGTPFLYAFCKYYNLSADYLLGKIDEPKYLN